MLWLRMKKPMATLRLQVQHELIRFMRFLNYLIVTHKCNIYICKRGACSQKEQEERKRDPRNKICHSQQGSDEAISD